jgi:ABC-2 type transport system ATP-binding protein
MRPLSEAVAATDGAPSALGDAMLRLEDVSFSYGARRALDRVSFSVMPGRVTMLIGPNGAGKTTLFSLVCRLLPLTSGKIAIAGRSIEEGPKVLGTVGVVFQQPTIDLDMTVRQNLLYYASLRGLSRPEGKARLEEELGRLGIAARANDRVRDLNGGHRRRVEIARALMDRPRLMLLDEPTVGLDIPTRQALVAYVHSLAGERGVSVLWATHLIDEIAPEDEVVVLASGRLAATGSERSIVQSTGSADLNAAFRKLTGGEGGES